jgi:type III secretion system YscQ/HrcQ family protein
MPDDPHKNDDTDFEDEFEDESFTDDDYDEDLDSSDENDFEDEGDVQDGDDENASFDDQEFDDSTPLEEEETEPQAEEESAPKSTKAALEKTQPVSPSEIPMSVVVEVGRIKMNMKKLMELQPGNVIDLDVNPEDGIDLTINGRCVAKAELLRVGETLGVRILDIG